MEPAPILPRTLQHVIRSDDIRFNKSSRAVDGAIYMRFGRQMHYRVRFKIFHSFTDGFFVADVRLQETVQFTVLTKYRQTAEPIKPAPPVTKIRFIKNSSGIWLIVDK